MSHILILIRFIYIKIHFVTSCFHISNYTFQVCKLWHSVVSDIKIEELALIDQDDPLHRQLKHWPFTNRPIVNVVFCKFINLLESSFLNLKNLKYLLINFDLEPTYNQHKILYKFPNLENLFLNYIFTIDCPRLHTLRCSPLTLMRIKHPETLRFIAVYSFEDNILNFKNLEEIEVCDIGQSVNILEQLPHLKAISINPHKFGRCLSICAKDVSNLINEKQRLKKDVKIYLDEKEINDIQQFDEIIANGR